MQKAVPIEQLKEMYVSPSLLSKKHVGPSLILFYQSKNSSTKATVMPVRTDGGEEATAANTPKC